MKKKCKEIQTVLVENFDDKFEISDEMMLHINTCSDCHVFYQHLVLINEQLTINTEQIQTDYDLINQAVDEGIKKRQVKENRWENLGFLMVIITIFFAVGVMIRFGYSQLIVMTQIMMVTTSPMIIPFVIRKQIKGDQHE
jgi:hypothetical protein